MNRLLACNANDRYGFGMRLVIVVSAVALLCVPSPVGATSSIFCRSTDLPQLTLDLSVGHPPVAIGNVSFNDGSGTLDTGADQAQIVIAQSWLDEDELKLDLADGNVENFIVKLRTRRLRDGVYAGTMRYRERTVKIDCRFEEEME
jgi:hypothetical protein